MVKIREVTISGTDYSLDTVIGYEGEHNITNLNIKLPAELISGNIDYYTVDFQTNDDDVISSGHLQQTGGYIITKLWQQITIQGTLKFQVKAWALTGSTIDMIGMTPVISRLIGESVDGNAVLLDEEVSGLIAELQELIANYPVTMGTFTEGSEWNFELVDGKLNIIYVPSVDGIDGVNGSATVSIGTVTTGTPASITNSGTSTAAILNFVIPAGTNGTDGLSIRLLGSVDDYTELPNNGDGGSNVEDGDCYITTDTGHLWTYLNNQWNDVGKIVGDNGSNGLDGNNGLDGSNGINGVNGREIELDIIAGEIAWRYYTVNSGGWHGLVTIASLTGTDGEAATVSVGTVTDGETASVTNVGTSNAAVLNFVLKQGENGTNGVDLTLPPIVAYIGTLAIGNSYTLTTGSNPTFTLPTVTDATKINQFRIEIKATSALTVTWIGDNLRAGAVAHVYGIGNHVIIGTWSTVESKWLLDAQIYGAV